MYDMANESHQKVKEAKVNFQFDKDFVYNAHRALGMYLGMLLRSDMGCSSACLTSKVATLEENKIVLSDNAYKQAAVIDAAYHNSAIVEKEYARISACYFGLRTSILQCCVSNYPMHYKDGKVYHPVTGVTIEATEYAYTYQLEKFYEL